MAKQEFRRATASLNVEPQVRTATNKFERLYRAAGFGASRRPRAGPKVRIDGYLRP